MMTFLLVIHILVCIALIAVVLMQRSEGGALGMGGGPSGFMTARGAGDLLTRTTWILFAVFMVLSLGLTILGSHAKNDSGLHIDRIDPNALGKPAAPAAPTTPTAPLPGQGGGLAAPSPLTAPSPSLRAPTSPLTAPTTPAPAEPAKK